MPVETARLAGPAESAPIVPEAPRVPKNNPAAVPRAFATPITNARCSLSESPANAAQVMLLNSAVALQLQELGDRYRNVD
jgi:hypothetical protein